eukprot:2070711-Amphidinium_carterae.1
MDKALLLAIVAGFGVVGTSWDSHTAPAPSRRLRLQPQLGIGGVLAAACLVLVGLSKGPVARTPYPPRPQAYILRPDTDPRLDASVLVRFDPPEHLRTERDWKCWRDATLAIQHFLTMEVRSPAPS